MEFRIILQKHVATTPQTLTSRVILQDYIEKAV
jgi:hypothetical protein